MAWPPGRVNARDQPLIAAAPVLAMVRLSVRPLFQALTVSVTRHVPESGGVVGEVVGGVVGEVVGGVVGEVVGGVVGGVVVPPLRPKNAIAYAAMPLDGRLCPAPWMLYASTSR